jgi:hypothetical protein
VALRTGQVPIFAGSAQVMDLADFNKAFGQPVDGILGWDFFERWCTTLDFAQKRLTLRPPSRCGPPTGTESALKGMWSAHGLMLRAQIAFPNGRSTPALLSIDTGSDATLVLNTQFRPVAGLPPNQPSDARPDSGDHGTSGVAAVAWGANGAYSGDIVPVASVDIEHGKIHMNGEGKATVLIARRGSFTAWHWWQTADGEARINHDGSIGNVILEDLLWTFDPVAKKIYIQAYGH